MNSTQSTEIFADQITKYYQSHNGKVYALENVTFKISAGEIVCIVGPSGCGKSTLLKILSGLIEPTSGQVRFSKSSNESGIRTALIFQEHGLFPWMTILDNVAFGLENLGVGKIERQKKAQVFLEQLGLGEFSHYYPSELSGGMRQRAVIARAVLVEPNLLLMDEPFSGLDAQSKLILQEEMLRIWKTFQQTVIYVTHEIEEAILLGDRVLLMTGRPGSIKEEIEVLLDRPRDLRDRDQPFVREMKWHIWKAIEGQVRQSLHVSG
jgi:NitT/TauT family transport system ATP-binding protein